jgi:hypothetical protein
MITGPAARPRIPVPDTVTTTVVIGLRQGRAISETLGGGVSVVPAQAAHVHVPAGLTSTEALVEIETDLRRCCRFGNVGLSHGSESGSGLGGDDGLGAGSGGCARRDCSLTPNSVRESTIEMRCHLQ